MIARILDVTLGRLVPRVGRDRAAPVGFVLAAYALAFWQRPGWATSDTKIDLMVDPGRFLGDVAALWTPTAATLGEVHSAQYAGYLFPMGPWFALGKALGLAPWVTQRLWLGTILALGVWGLIKLLDELVGRPRGAAHVVAAALFLLNPYVNLFTARTSVILLGYAALPWLLLTVHRGVRDPRGWWWPAAFALILASTGGGVNAAVVAWMLLGPALLLAYEPALGHVRWRASAGFLWRAAAAGLLASLWWIVPLLAHVRFGIDFLQFTEHPRTIWSTTSVTETLRLMGYWLSYIGVGFDVQRPYFSHGGTMLFEPLVVLSSLLVPALALAGFMWTRRWRYAPFFLLLVLVGLVVMVSGFPAGTPFRKGLNLLYENVFVLRFLRTTYKAGPLVGLGLAGLGGLAAREAWWRLRALPHPRRRVATLLAPAAVLALIACAAWPTARGRGLDEQLLWKRIPAAWQATGRDLDRDLPANARAAILPGQLVASYRWGETVDPILPRLTDRPVAARFITPYADLHAVDLLWSLDALVQQRRLVPGQLQPLLRLLGVGAVVTGADDDVTRSGALDPARAARQLEAQGLSTPARSYGPAGAYAPGGGDLDPAARLPQVRRYDLPPGRGIVRVEPSGPPVIVDGSASALAGLAAFGALPERRPVLYAADRTAGELAQMAEGGAELVVSDANRRRIFVPPQVQQNVGATLGADDPLPLGAVTLNPFEPRGTDAQTVAVYQGGARYLRAPFDPGFQQFPEHRPYAAFDGDLHTAWQADVNVLPEDRWVEIGFDEPRDVPWVDVYPASGANGVVTDVAVNRKETKVHRGWNRVQLGARGATKLRIRLTGVRQPEHLRGAAGGFREIRIPGLKVRELLRSPVVSARALAGRDLDRVGLTYLFERATGDEPSRRLRYGDLAQLPFLSDRGDPERRLARLVFSPVARSYSVDARLGIAVEAPDDVLDRLAGMRGDASFTSSSRYQNLASLRASSAFDGRADRPWVATWLPLRAPAWLAWRSSRPLTVGRLRLVPVRGRVRRPTRVRVSWHGGRTPPLPVGLDGTVRLPRPARARAFRLSILAAELPPGSSTGGAPRAVGVAELRVPGLEPVDVPRAGALRAACGSARLRVGGRSVPLRPRGTVAQLEEGQALPARSCGGETRMGAGVQTVRALRGPFSVDHLRLRSAAPSPPPQAGGGRVLRTGHMGRSDWTGVEVDLEGPSWLVLGQGYNKGWRAECDGRSLGKPEVVDGFANGWRAPAGCRRVAFSFAPQRAANLSYAISLLAVVVLAAYVALGRRRRLVAGAAPRRSQRLPEGAATRWPPARAALAGVLAAVPLGYVFSIRSGIVIAPLIALVLWRGYGARALAAAAGLLLGVAVPVLYAVELPQDKGGFNTEYAVELIWAHWVGLAAVILLGMACWRALAAARSATGEGRSPPRPGSAISLTPEPEERAALTGADRR